MYEQIRTKKEAEECLNGLCSIYKIKIEYTNEIKIMIECIECIKHLINACNILDADIASTVANINTATELFKVNSQLWEKIRIMEEIIW